MASESQIEERDDIAPSRIPQPVAGGTEHLESLGRFIDDLMGDSRRQHETDRDSASLFLRDDEMPEDPAPSEPPPPVDEGNEDFAEGAKPGGEE